jgi:hypothetical protein
LYTSAPPKNKQKRLLNEVEVVKGVIHFKRSSEQVLRLVVFFLFFAVGTAPLNGSF